jgi:hypothetical protein
MRTHECRAPAGPSGVSGAEDLVRQLGCWPCFHDAEIVELALDRTGESTLKLSVLDPRTTGACIRVVFGIREISGLELQEFSSQNVIGQLQIEEVDGEQRISMSPCYGLNGWIQARDVRVRVEDDRPHGA